HVRPGLPGRDGAQRARPGRAHDDRPLRPLPRPSGGDPGARPDRRRRPAGHRLHRRDDRPLLHLPLRRPGDPRAGPLLVARISSDSINQVRDAADITEVIGAYTDLKRAGGQMMGLCPFHDERSPSFSVDPTDKLYHCFGCGEAGDIFGFVMEKEGLGFSEAVEALADRYGVELQREQEDPRAEARRQARQRLQQLLERSAAYYASYLWESREAGKARDYLAERGLTESALRDFGVGFAPSAWDKILVAGQRAGFRVDELRAVGLVQKSRQGGEYDRFRSRIMFPIRDARGRTLGFGGRAMRDDQGAKYVNTAETDFFHKSQILYGLDRARAAMARANRAVVVEGYTDVIALH